jgi:hypothetical protein
MLSVVVLRAAVKLTDSFLYSKAPKRPDSDPLPNYLELKTSKLIESSRDKHIFERYAFMEHSVQRWRHNG